MTLPAAQSTSSDGRAGGAPQPQAAQFRVTMAQPGDPTPAGYRQLKVEDALAYLDEVNNRNPHVAVLIQYITFF